ncbi:BolA-like protein [Ordospora colligata OC4]|uniref:BolA-like protein n=1 Tax=Ordospora colligata OC4 TaxID=1354746 RepID=A0A0B2UCR8_9MICR|nr:BolA-like protein [Ordospora colligata OC4]KHN68816.1 BolA-like protein [Ordospora colligata OC4]TBU13850.1 BolA-like protein [Ordospora colligata]TBU14039.1 BolA-like protein [Ordospora colligata]
MDNRIIEKSIRDALEKRFRHSCMEITNTSPDHKGHLDSSKTNTAETHFSIKIKSETFNQMKISDRHRLVHTALDDAFENGLHAIEIDCESDYSQSN